MSKGTYYIDSKVRTFFWNEESVLSHFCLPSCTLWIIGHTQIKDLPSPVTVEGWPWAYLYSVCKYSPLLSFTIFSELGGLLKYVRPFLNSISKAKAARLVRSLLDMFLDMEAATGQEVELCLECIEWAKAEKRTFLRQALEVRLGGFAGIVHIKQFVQPAELFFFRHLC